MIPRLCTTSLCKHSWAQPTRTTRASIGIWRSPPGRELHKGRRPILDFHEIMAANNAEGDVRAKLKSQFQGHPAESHPQRWDDLWQQGLTPWDRNGPSIALKDAITSNPEIFPSSTPSSPKRALVPGCGRGYDVLLLSSLGYDAYGADASATAISAAQQFQRESGDSIPVIKEGGNATFLVQDFFAGDLLSQTTGSAETKFDLIFDYTFLCALPSELRPRWAKQMHSLLAENGRLVCLEWPLGKPPKEGGPPHGLTSELYVQLLAEPGSEVEYDADGRVISNEQREKSERGLLREKHFQPERTHEAGKGKDYLSIWKHACSQ